MNRRCHIALLLSLMTPSAYSLAADGTINFSGAIRDSACVVNVNSINQTVQMGNIAAASMQNTGATSGAVRFTITLASCPPTDTFANLRFEGSVAPSDANILSLNSGQTATNVGIALYESDATTRVALNANTRRITLTSGTRDYTYYATYIATGTPVGPGSANATATFTIIYLR